jgi:hypothetical protein
VCLKGIDLISAAMTLGMWPSFIQKRFLWMSIPSSQGWAGLMLLMTPFEYNLFSKVCLLHTICVKDHRSITITIDQSLPNHLPQVSTLRGLFTRHLDIHAVPKRSFFRLLKHFAADPREREKLEEFSSSDGAVG